MTQTMLVGIFEDGLQNHRWNQCVVQLRLHKNLLLNAPIETSVLHGHVHFVELHLVTEGNQLRLTSFQTDTQETAELFKHQIGGCYVGTHQTRDAIQGVEKKVGIEVGLHRMKSRLRQLDFEFRRRGFFLSISLVVTDSTEQKERAPKDH